MPVIKLHKPGLVGAFNLALWNSAPYLGGANCLAYALGAPDMGWAIPGGLSDEDVDHTAPFEITAPCLRAKFIEDDGLVEITRAEALSGKFHAFALRLHPGHNFHVLRAVWNDQSGVFWMHKPGPTPVSSVDYAGKPIADAESGEFGKYHEFAGYFAIPAGGVRYIAKIIERWDSNTEGRISYQPTLDMPRLV